MKLGQVKPVVRRKVARRMTYLTMSDLSKFYKNAIGGNNHTLESSVERGKPQRWGHIQVIIAEVCWDPSMEAPLPSTKQYRKISSTRNEL